MLVRQALAEPSPALLSYIVLLSAALGCGSPSTFEFILVSAKHSASQKHATQSGRCVVRLISEIGGNSALIKNQSFEIFNSFET